MVRDDFIAWWCAGSLMVVTWSGFGWYIAPEPAELKLAKIRAGLDLSMPIRTLPPETKIQRCILMWVGGPGGQPELWCPGPLVPAPAEPTVPTS